MEKLILTSNNKITKTSLKFKRYLLSEINWNNRLIALKGARGSGKTTLLLQYINSKVKNKSNVLYVAMDDLYFMENNLLELAKRFCNFGGKILLLDEVHKYPNWSREIKLIYDDMPDLQVVFTSSSLLEIYKGESDLSRRVVSYNLKELSLREYIELNYGIQLPKYSFQEIIKNHTEIASELTQKIKPIPSQFNNFQMGDMQMGGFSEVKPIIPLFNEYLKFGAYPYFREGIENYFDKLRNTINLIIEIDLNAVENLDYSLLVKIKKLLYLISTNVPFTPNITKLSQQIGVSRPTLIHALHQLEKARLIIQLSKSDKGNGILTKPDKLFLNNTNLAYALANENVNSGNNRETFFANQLEGIIPYKISEKSDFFVDNKYTIEIGGKNKRQKQIENIPNAFILKDDIELGALNMIPLWLFGFLY